MKRLEIRRETLAPLTEEALATVAGGTVTTLRCPSGPISIEFTYVSCITRYCTGSVGCEG